MRSETSEHEIHVTDEEIEAERERRAAFSWLPTPLPCLRDWRLRRGYTQAQLAVRSGLHVNTVHALERRDAEKEDQVASEETIKKLMVALDVSDARWFVEQDGFVIEESLERERQKAAKPIEGLRGQRKARGLSQVGLAERAGVHANTVRAAEAGGSVSAESGRRISGALAGKDRT